MDEIIDLLQVKIEKAKAQLPEDTQNAINAVDWRAAILDMRTKKGFTFEQLGDLELETELLLCGLLTPENYPKELASRMKLSQAQVNDLVLEMNKQVFSKMKEELIKNTERKTTFEKTFKNDYRPIEKTDFKIIPARNAFSIADAGGEPLPASDINSEKIIENREEMLKKIEDSASLPKSEIKLDKLELGAGPKEEIVPAKSPESPQDTSVQGGIDPILAQKLSAPVAMQTIKTEYSLNNITKTNTPNPQDIKAKIPAIDPYREIPE